jgi:prophage antirepressor-like protein
MENKNEVEKVALFDGQKIRRVLISDEWWFSVVDVVKVLVSESDDYNDNAARKYWNKLAQRLRDEGSELVTFCHQLKLVASDGKKYATDCANTEGIFRIIQSIPSPKAEPFKRWLAKVGYERVQEIENPELAMDRMKAIYEKKGYSKDWIDKRSRGIAVRHGLTDEWRDRGVKKGSDYAILTNEIMECTFGLKANEYKNLKGLDRENLRDHMEDIELILTMLGEATTTKLTQVRDSQGFIPLKKDASDGGGVAGRTREDIEKLSGTKVVSPNNFLEQNNQKLKSILN